MSAAEVAGRLAERQINVSTTVPQHDQLDTQNRGVHPLVRVSPHYYNGDDEIDQVLQAFAALTG